VTTFIKSGSVHAHQLDGGYDDNDIPDSTEQQQQRQTERK
jgi:hypothetical protein